MKLTRKIVFRFLRYLTALTSVVLLIGISVVVVIISQGKKINNNGDFIQTSIIRIDVFPKDIKAFVDEREVSLNENRIENLEPGSHKVKLTKQGYISWEKEIALESGIVKDIHAQLYPEAVKFELVTKSNVNKLFYSSDLEYIYYTITSSKISSENGIWKLKLNKNLLDFSENKPFLIAKFDQVLLNQLKNNYLIDIADDNNKILLTINDEIYIIYDANQLNAKIDLNESLGFTPNKVKWLKNSQTLLITKNNIIFEYDLDLGQSTLINFSSEKESIYDSGANVVYFLKNSKLFKYTNKTTSLIKLPQKSLDLLNNIKSITTPNFNSNIIIFNSDSGLILIDQEKNFADVIDAKGSVISVSTNGKLIIYEKDGLLYSFILENSVDGKSYKSTANQLELKRSDLSSIYFSSNIKNIVSFAKLKDGSNKLVLMDIDGTNKRSILEDFQILGDTILISKSSSELYGLVREKSIDNEISDNIYKFSLEAKK